MTPSTRTGPAADIHPPAALVKEAVTRALAEDLLALGDLTAALVPDDRSASLVIAVRKPGVIAGQRCAEEAFAQVDPRIKVQWRIPDGESAEARAVVAKVDGPLRSILSAERTALNFLGHLSGVASLTRRFVDAASAVAPTVRILDTRKTTPGLRALEKAAVRAGGGHNHRASLSDAVLVKDNHLGALSITAAVTQARAMWPGRMVEIECERPEQVEEACRAGASAVLLDNMSPEEVAHCVSIAREIAGAKGVLVEVSGGLTMETIADYAATGVDLLSVGALTHSAPSLDVGLDLVDLIGGLAGGNRSSGAGAPDGGRE